VTALRNRRIVFSKRAEGLPDAACWELIENEPVAEPAAGQVIVQVSHLSIDPAMRAWMDADAHDFPAVLGKTMLALGVGRVVQSAFEGLSPGDAVLGPLGVQELAVLPGYALRKVDESVAPLTAWLGVLGMTAGLTAYVGMVSVGEVSSDDVVLVSGAAGAVGSVAGQIARIVGARVIGIAGGPEKTRYLVEELGFDDAIDYKAGNVHAAIGACASEGVDLFFDNVGGEILDAALDHIATEARVVLCGAISQYNHREQIQGPRLYLRIPERNAKMLGFTVDHYVKQFAEMEARLARWLAEDKLRLPEHVEVGIENYPSTLLKLFDGSHIGKLLLQP
jgi:NADPH-dependent curcumin reductase CurA